NPQNSYRKLTLFFQFGWLGQQMNSDDLRLLPHALSERLRSAGSFWDFTRSAQLNKDWPL
ncbi:hypothetical protein, partial [Zooshikella ganghwensis]|uniref:hypothetical protein n=1 Tax=Zooshikella ganghwensis TaxID=202772 RepID=UPI00197F364D